MTNVNQSAAYLESWLVEHCAPTLAGLKPASLFTWAYPSLRRLAREVRWWTQALRPRGVEVTVLQMLEGRALLYVFRRSQLEGRLREQGIEQFLKSYGYCEWSAERALVRLRHRLREYPCFPHEIGVFLGYPLEDICGFIANQGQNCKYCGYWKVYGDEAWARWQFEQFRSCTDALLRQYESGTSVVQLTVAA